LWTGNGSFRFVEACGRYFPDFLPYSAYKIFVHDLKLKRKYNWLTAGAGAIWTPGRGKIVNQVM
jgi:hypothetical protein